MNVLCLDLEMNQPSRTIIQVGAVVFKARTGELLEAFSTYVHPPFETINPSIVELTGITDEMVKDAPLVQNVYKALEGIHKKHKCFKNPLVWGAGRSNDSLLLYDQAKRYLPSDEQNFMGFRVTDVKCLFQSLAMFKNIGVKAGVEKACNKFHIGFDEKFGKPHNALADAYNTMRLWHHMMIHFAPGFTLNLRPVSKEGQYVLSNEDFDKFVEEINNPSPPNEALKAAAKRFAKNELSPKTKKE